MILLLEMVTPHWEAESLLVLFPPLLYKFINKMTNGQIKLSKSLVILTVVLSVSEEKGDVN